MKGVVTLLVMAATVSAARAQEATWDPAEIAHLAEKSAQSALALSQMIESLANLQRMALAAGSSGLPTAAGYTQVHGAQGLLGLEQGVLAGATTNPGALTPGDATLGDRATASATRQTMRQQAAQNSIALSLYAGQDATRAAADSTLVLNRSQSAIDVRTDVEANTAGALAVLTTVVMLKAMVAGLVEMRAVDGSTGQALPAQGGS